MGIHICGAPCCWGVDDISNPHLPTWQRVLREAHEAGYSAIELGPNGWIPTDDIESVTEERIRISCQSSQVPFLMMF